MTQISHDHNFKNLFMDFPMEALQWISPRTLETYGKILNIEFVRQEPKKSNIVKPHRALDMPILFTFELRQILLWLVEFQEDKIKFSIYKLLRYVADMMEAYPNALVIPTVLFTDRKNWRKDVDRQLNSKFEGRIFLHFEYQQIRVFKYNARDYYHSQNPLVRILLPKMNYLPEERTEVIRQAYIGLFQLTSSLLFDKYVDFIDIYAEIGEKERDMIYYDLKDHQETAMLAQYIRNKGKLDGETAVLCRQIAKKYNVSSEKLRLNLENLNTEMLLDLSEHILDWDSYEKVQEWIESQKNKQKSF